MRTPALWGITVLLWLPGTTTNAYQATVQSTDVNATYDALMKVDSPQRLDQFRAMTPEMKAPIVRTHAQRWLEMNRARLSPGQVVLVREAIAFVTPELYRSPQEPAQLEKEERLKSQLKCQLPRSDIMEMFGAVRPPPSNSSWLDDVWVWFEECVVG